MKKGKDVEGDHIIPRVKGSPNPVDTGRIGGQRRAQALSPERRTQIARQAAAERHKGRVMRATHTGALHFGDVVIPCAVLADGKRVVSHSAFRDALGRSRPGGATYRRTSDRDRLPIFLALKVLKPFIPDDFAVATIAYVRSDGGPPVWGLEASAVPVVCRIWLSALAAGALRPQERPTAERAGIILAGLAEVGIVSLVDEATGYEVDRVRGSLAKILEAFIDKELAAWSKTFPDEFYVELCRLKKMPVGQGSARPGCMGGLTNNVVYERLAPGVLDELRRINPIRDGGRRAVQHHRWLTRHIGYIKLREHLAKTVMLMQVTSTWDEFLTFLDRYAPRVNRNLPLPFQLPPPSRLQPT